MALELRPGVAAVVCDIDAAPRAAALASVCVELELPHRGEQGLRVTGMHDHIDGAGVLVDEEHAFPRRTAVGRAIHTAFLLRTVAVALCSDEDDFRVGGIDDDAPGAARRIGARV